MQSKTKKTLRNVALVLVVVILALVLWLKLANVSWFRYVIEEQVSAHTGYLLSIEGPISIKLWPLSASMRDVHLYNPADFAESQPDFIYVPEIRVGLRLMPLLVRDYQFKDITLIDPVINLERNKFGRANWDFGIVNSETREIFGEAAENNKPNISRLVLGFAFDNVKVKNGRILYHDHRAFSEGGFDFTEVELTAGPFSNPQNRLNFEFKAKSKNVPLNIKGYTTETLAQILSVEWPYEVQLHLTSNSFGLPKN